MKDFCTLIRKGKYSILYQPKRLLFKYNSWTCVCVLNSKLYTINVGRRHTCLGLCLVWRQSMTWFFVSPSSGNLTPFSVLRHCHGCVCVLTLYSIQGNLIIECHSDYVWHPFLTIFISASLLTGGMRHPPPHMEGDRITNIVTAAMMVGLPSTSRPSHMKSVECRPRVSPGLCQRSTITLSAHSPHHSPGTTGERDLALLR